MQQDGNNEEIIGYKIGRSFRHFGHNAPKSTIVTKGDTIAQENTSYKRWTSKNSLSSVTANDPILLPTHFPLASAVNDITPGVTLLINNSPRPLTLGNKKDATGATGATQKFNAVVAESRVTTAAVGEQPRLTSEVQTLVTRVKESRSISMSWGPLTGESTLVILDKQLGNESFNQVDIR
jgi:hypothetical protein